MGIRKCDVEGVLRSVCRSGRGEVPAGLQRRSLVLHPPPQKKKLNPKPPIPIPQSL